MEFIKVRKGQTYTVIAGKHYKLKSNALALAEQVKAKGLPAIVCITEEYYIVQVGAYDNVKEAQKMFSTVCKAGFPANIIITKTDEVAQ